MALHYLDPTHLRFWAKVKRVGGCWEWQGAKRRRGYGNFWDGRRMVGAHRWAWARHHKRSAEGFYVLHHCDNPACVRPSHLYLGDHSDNMQDASSRGRLNIQAAVQASCKTHRSRTHCPKGHKLPNGLDSEGRRRCRECRRNSQREWWRRNHK